MKEIWKNIKGFEGLYQKSNLGRVRRLPRTHRWVTQPIRILKPILERKTPRFILSKDGIPRKLSIKNLKV